MPFQVVFSARQAPMSNITGVDIPTEKVNFCQIYVTLEAKVLEHSMVIHSNGSKFPEVQFNGYTIETHSRLHTPNLS